jgi:anti-sigma factor RsiW
MLTCRDFIDFIAEYLSDELPPTDREAFEYHLADCPDCQKYLHSYQATIAVSRSVFANLDGPVPDEVPEELIQAILAVRR